MLRVHANTVPAGTEKRHLKGEDATYVIGAASGIRQVEGAVDFAFERHINHAALRCCKMQRHRTLRKYDDETNPAQRD